MKTSRRGLLLGAGGGIAAVAAVGGVRELRRPDVELPDVDPGPVRRGTVDGSSWVVCEPPGGGAGRPVVLAWHGASYDADALVTQFGVDRFLAASGQRFVIAATDDLGLTLGPLRTLLGERGYDVTRPALLGWSAGGYAALAAAVADPAELAAVALASPALRSGDDPAGVEALQGLPLRVDCGRQDPFVAAVRAFRDRLSAAGVDATFSFADGAHNVAYWTRVLPGQLTWLGSQLASRSG